MTHSPLAIAQVNRSEHGGGAELVARQLHDGYRQRGHASSLLVGRGEVSDEHAYRFPVRLAAKAAHLAAGPMRLLDRQRGLETYRYPGTWSMLDALPRKPDVVHLHNLHGGYFDLRVLPDLSQRLPVALTLHDAWLMSGHCAHSFGCERWRTGCGACPDLSIYPAVRRDATAENWRRKRDIFARSQLYVATPSAWLGDRVAASPLAPAVKGRIVIPNGVCLKTFSPGGRDQARAALGLPHDACVLLFAGARSNAFKDFGTVERAVRWAAEALEKEVVLLVLGEEGEPERAGRAETRFVPYQEVPARVADHFRASDLYLHGARADTFPTAILEALACGIPVVASRVGGIPEQIRPLEASNPTGVLVDAEDHEAMGRAIVTLMADLRLRDELGANAVHDAAARFDVLAQQEAYLAWYRQIIEEHRRDGD